MNFARNAGKPLKITPGLIKLKFFGLFTTRNLVRCVEGGQERSNELVKLFDQFKSNWSKKIFNVKSSHDVFQRKNFFHFFDQFSLTGPWTRVT